MGKQIPVGQGLFTWPSSDPRLIGTHCKSCGNYYFPKMPTCPNPDCKEKQVEEVSLSKKGKLWSYSVLHYPPPPPFVVGPEPFKPQPIAEVEMPEGLKVIGMTEGMKPEDMKFGMEMEVTIGKLYTDKNGDDWIGWKFKPAK